MHSKNTILIIDDEEVAKKRLRDVITDEFDVVEASDGKEGLEILAENPQKVAVIVLDLIMPVMDGFQFMDAFRQHQEYDNITVLLVYFQV